MRTEMVKNEQNTKNVKENVVTMQVEASEIQHELIKSFVYDTI